MPFFDETPWEVAAWIMTAVVSWLIGMYFAKSDCNRKFENTARPYLFPSFMAYHVIMLVFQIVLAIACYWVWVDGGWVAHPIPLSLALGAQLVLIPVSHFVTWWFWTSMSVFIGGIIMIAAAAAVVVALVWIFWSAHFWAFAFALAAAIVFLLMGILTIYLSFYGNTHVIKPGTKCHGLGTDVWVTPASCDPECPEDGPVCVRPRSNAAKAATASALEDGKMEAELTTVGLDLTNLSGIGSTAGSRNFQKPPQIAIMRDSKYTR